MKKAGEIIETQVSEKIALVIAQVQFFNAFCDFLAKIMLMQKVKNHKRSVIVLFDIHV